MITRIDNWKSLAISLDSSLAQALEVIGIGGCQIALVLNSQGRLEGIVSDSDVRKALLRNITINNSILDVMNTQPLVVSPELDDREAQRILQLNGILHLPIVNNDGILIGLHVANHIRIPETRKESFVIMAGGKGKRLLPLTEKTPKPMLPIKGKPILRHIIENAKSEGFVNFAISVNYLRDQIIDYFGNGNDFGINITYIHEDSPLGTAGSLASLPSELTNYPIVVTNADVITDVSYVDLLANFKNDNADGVMAVRVQEWQNQFGIVQTNGNSIISIEEKPVYRQQVNAGIYVLTKKLLKALKPGVYCDMTDLFSRGIEIGCNLTVFPLHESWIDIGRPSDYQSVT